MRVVKLRCCPEQNSGPPNTSTYITRALCSPWHRPYITHYAALGKPWPVFGRLTKRRKWPIMRGPKLGYMPTNVDPAPHDAGSQESVAVNNTAFAKKLAPE